MNFLFWHCILKFLGGDKISVAIISIATVCKQNVKQTALSQPSNYYQ